MGATVGAVIDGLTERIFGNGDSGRNLADCLNQHLQPHMLDLALNITGLDHVDLFYYKNKVRIDEVALSFRETAGHLG